MKRIALTLIAMACYLQATAQSPEWLNYYAHQLKDTLPDSALVMLDKAFLMAAEQKNTYTMAISKKVAGQIHKQQRNNASAYLHSMDALDLFSKADTADYWNMYSAHRDISLIMNRMKGYEHAVAHTDSAIHYMQLFIDRRNKRDSLKNEGDKIPLLEFYKSRYLRKLGQTQASDNILFDLQKRMRGENWTIYADVQLELGMAFYGFTDYEMALNYFASVIKLDNIEIEQMADAYHHLGATELKLKRYQAAISHLHQAVEYNKNNKDYRYLFVNYQKLGEAYNAMGDLSLSLQYYKQALAVFPNVGEDKDLFAIYRSMERAGSELNHPNYRAWGDTYDSLDKAFTSSQAAIMEEERRQLFWADVRREISNERNAITEQQRLARMMPFALLGLVALAGGVYWYRTRTIYLSYADAAQLARQLIDDYSSGQKSPLKYFIDQHKEKFSYAHSTLRKAIGENDPYTNQYAVQGVLNILSKKRYKVNAPQEAGHLVVD